MAFVNIFSNETFFAVLWPALRTVVLVQKFQFPPLSMSSPLLNSNIVLCFCFLKENVDSFSVSVSLSLMYLCIYCIYSKNTQNGSKNLKIYCPVKISQLYYEKTLSFISKSPGTQEMAPTSGGGCLIPPVQN